MGVERSEPAIGAFFKVVAAGGSGRRRLQQGVHQCPQAAQVHGAGARVGMQRLPQQVPLAGIVFGMCAVAKKWMCPPLAPITGNTKAPVFVPRNQHPLARVVGVTVKIKVLPDVIGVINDGAHSKIVNQIADIKVVEHELFSRGRRGGQFEGVPHRLQVIVVFSEAGALLHAITSVGEDRV